MPRATGRSPATRAGSHRLQRFANFESNYFSTWEGVMKIAMKECPA